MINLIDYAGILRQVMEFRQNALILITYQIIINKGLNNCV